MRTEYSFCRPLCCLIICCQWSKSACYHKSAFRSLLNHEENTCFCLLTKPISTFCFSVVDVSALVFLHSPSSIFCVTYLLFSTCFPLLSNNEQRQCTNWSLWKKAFDKVYNHYCLNSDEQPVYVLYFQNRFALNSRFDNSSLVWLFLTLSVLTYNVLENSLLSNLLKLHLHF